MTDIFQIEERPSIQMLKTIVQYLGVLLSHSVYSGLPWLLYFWRMTTHMSQVPRYNYPKCLLVIYLLDSL